MRLRFTIRDLFWLTLVAALAVGWWADHHRTEETHRIEQPICIVCGDICGHDIMMRRVDSGSDRCSTKVRELP
jgi:hypothetical protein